MFGKEEEIASMLRSCNNSVNIKVCSFFTTKKRATSITTFFSSFVYKNFLNVFLLFWYRVQNPKWKFFWFFIILILIIFLALISFWITSSLHFARSVVSSFCLYYFFIVALDEGDDCLNVLNKKKNRNFWKFFESSMYMRGNYFGSTHISWYCFVLCKNVKLIEV